MFLGKLWESVQKQIQNHFQECLYYQPAIIVIDDFDDLCHLNSEPNEYDNIMSNINLRYTLFLSKVIFSYVVESIFLVYVNFVFTLYGCIIRQYNT